MTIALTWSTADTISSELTGAATKIDDTAASAPQGVDAGDATPVIAQLIARVSESAAGLSEGLGVAGTKATDAIGTLHGSDTAAQTTFGSAGTPR